MEALTTNFFNSGRRWGCLRLLFVLFTLIVFMFLGMIGFGEISGGSFRYLFLPLAALLGSIFFISRYLQDTYFIRKYRINLHYLLAALFAINYPRLTISKGKMEAKPGDDNLLQVIGGPGVLDVKPRNLVLLENLYGPYTVLAEGKHSINHHSKIKETVCLDEQHGFIEEVKGRSKDGIPIRVNGVNFRYKLVTGAIPTLADPYPYDGAAFMMMAYNRKTTLSDGSTSWHKEVTQVVEGAIREYVNQHQFDHLMAPNFLEDLPRDEIQSLVFSTPVKDKLLEFGAELLWVGVGHFGIEEKVKDQRLDTWGAKWVGDATVVKAYGEAQRMIYQEIGRAEGQAELIMSIINALNAAAVVGPSAVNQKRILLMRTSQILEAIAQPPKSLPPPKTEGKPPRKPRSRR